MNNKNSVSSRARTTFRMQRGKIFSVTLIFAGLLFILGIASPARAEDPTKKAESLNDKLPSFLDKKTVSGSFRETGESRTREIADVESETGAVMMESAQRAEEDLRDIQSRMESTGSEKQKIRDDNDESSAEDDEEKED
jgi:hypothetical protein